MRILCLSFQQQQEPSCAEIFLTFSPRVQFRYPKWVFVDIESSTHLFGSEQLILERALVKARQIDPDARGAIADNPYSAQAFATYRPGYISESRHEIEERRSLPIHTLRAFEGLKAWPKPRQIEHIIEFFASLGLHNLEELEKFPVPSFRERWGETGVTVYQRLHNLDKQVISPLNGQEPLIGYAHYDEPVSMVPFLMAKIEPCLRTLFLRLEGLGRFAARLRVILHCEYSDKRYSIDIEPVSPGRDQKLFVDLLVEKLQKLDLENPIREAEIFIFDVPEKIQQLDFFESRDNTQSRWQRLISFAQQNSVEMGFLQIEKSPWPESSFSLKTDLPIEAISQDTVNTMNGALQVKSAYSKNIGKSPKPSLILAEPKLLSAKEKSDLRFVSRFPIERIEGGWWKKQQERDYFFALSKENQLLWVFQDRINQSYFVHGYFD
jgi:protein ImuB